jgi:hypothetical protein
MRKQGEQTAKKRYSVLSPKKASRKPERVKQYKYSTKNEKWQQGGNTAVKRVYKEYKQGGY